MYDVKDLFSPQRRRLLRGEAAAAPSSASPTPLAPGRWRPFADPAVTQRLQDKTEEAMEMLRSCGSSLQLCHQDLSGSRQSLRQCRQLLEAHQASSLAISELLTDWAALGGVTVAAARKGRRCGGRARCFFCRERRALEEQFRPVDLGSGDGDGALESAVLADVSGCSSTSSEVDHDTLGEHTMRGRPLLQRRKTSRERGQKLFKRSRKPQGDEAEQPGATWYATHTVDPPRSIGLPDPEVLTTNRVVTPVEAEATVAPAEGVSGLAQEKTAKSPARAKPLELTDLKDEELEPYASAAARFRAEMEFLDMSSFPASPEVKFLRRTSDVRLHEKARPLGLVIDVEAEVVGPPAPPPSTSHSMLVHTQLEAKDPLRGWKQLLEKTGLMARRTRRSRCIKLVVLRGWRRCCTRPKAVMAVHQPMAVRRPSKDGASSIASSRR